MTGIRKLIADNLDIWTSAVELTDLFRLKQEYAHKEALAKVYQSLKKQVKDLGGDND